MKKKVVVIFGTLIVCLCCSAAAVAQAKMLRLVKGHKVVLKGTVRDGDEKRYIFTAKEGQRLTVKVIGRDAIFSLYGGAVDSEKFADEVQVWSDRLPEGDEDNQYVLVLTSTYKVASYILEITLR
jgi:hypothetical protein